MPMLKVKLIPKLLCKHRLKIIIIVWFTILFFLFSWIYRYKNIKTENVSDIDPQVSSNISENIDSFSWTIQDETGIEDMSVYWEDWNHMNTTIEELILYGNSLSELISFFIPSWIDFTENLSCSQINKLTYKCDSSLFTFFLEDVVNNDMLYYNWKSISYSMNDSSFWNINSRIDVLSNDSDIILILIQ